MKNSIKYLVIVSFLPILFISVTRDYTEVSSQNTISNSISIEGLDEIELQENINLIKLPKPKPIPIPIPFPTPGK
jgi:hypothetical protein